MSYYIAPRFLDKLSIHITKNYLEIPGVKVPLILGVHGRKGEGKSFQCQLVFDRMGVEVVQMSSGELESPDAGDPARLVRLRYREAAELTKVRGRMAVLMIHDIDAGMGRVDQRTQYTVNTQLVAGTLMNIADDPTNVQLPGSYDAEPIQRIPIIVTGNDFSTLYAPLIRDGRMEKYYWEPSRDDRINIILGIFELDGISRTQIEQLVDHFPEQSIDFYSALHSRLYDEQIRQFIQNTGIDRVSMLVARKGSQGLPEFHKPNVNLSQLMELGQLIVREQDRIQELKLAQAYTYTNGDSLGQQAIGAIPASNREQNAKLSANGSWEGSAPARASSVSSLAVTPEMVRSLRELITQGLRIGVEYVDVRRFRTNAWQCYGVIEGNEREAIALLESCLSEHGRDYIRLVGIHPKDRHRVSESIVQRPQ